MWCSALHPFYLYEWEWTLPGLSQHKSPLGGRLSKPLTLWPAFGRFFTCMTSFLPCSSPRKKSSQHTTARLWLWEVPATCSDSTKGPRTHSSSLACLFRGDTLECPTKQTQITQPTRNSEWRAWMSLSVEQSDDDMWGIIRCLGPSSGYWSCCCLVGSSDSQSQNSHLCQSASSWVGEILFA